MVLLLALIKTGFTGKPAIAAVLLVVAALGGFGLLSWHARNQRLPSALVIVHALVAVTQAFLPLLRRSAAGRMATGRHATCLRTSHEEQGAAQHKEGDTRAICLT